MIHCCLLPERWHPGDQRSQRPYDGGADADRRDVGDAVNYTIGRLFGEKLFSNPIRKFSVAVISTKPISFMRTWRQNDYSRPFCADRQNVRPFVAGMGHMSYRHFAAYNVIGHCCGYCFLPTQAISSARSPYSEQP